MSAPFYVAFDEAHKPRGRINGNYSQLKAHLENRGFICQEFMEFPIMRQNLAPYDILCIPCPDFSKFSKDEISAIAQWVKEDGGGIIMLSHAGGDKGRRSNLSELAEKFGMQFENDQVLDQKENFGIENLPEIKNFNPPHPITEGIESICFRAGCSLSCFGSAALPVAISNDYSEPFNSPLIVAAEYENGRVIGCGSYEIFRDKIAGGFGQDQHSQLASNIFEWLKTSYRMELKSKSPQQAKVPSITGEDQDVASDPTQQPAGAQPMGFAPLNLKSDITISDKSDLAGLLYALLNEADVMKQQIQTIINTVIASEEQILDYQQPVAQMEIPQQGNNFNNHAPLEPQQEPVFPPNNGAPPSFTPPEIQQPETHSVSETKIGGISLFGQEEVSPMSPLPPRPPDMLSRPGEVNSNGIQQEYNGNLDQQQTYPPSEPQYPPQNVFQEESQNIFQEEQSAPEVPAINFDELKAEIETLQSKLSSIEDLRKLVENKFNLKKYTKAQFDKQMKRLENDKKKTLFRIEELENKIKNA